MEFVNEHDAAALLIAGMFELWLLDAASVRPELRRKALLDLADAQQEPGANPLIGMAAQLAGIEPAQVLASFAAQLYQAVQASRSRPRRASLTNRRRPATRATAQAQAA